jgi:hypothetical protein
MTLTVRSASSVLAPPGRPYTEDPVISTFYRDLLAPFGVAFDEDLLRTGHNVLHRELVDQLLDIGDTRSCRPELIIVSYGLPDVHPFIAVASHLNMLVGGGTATSFSISEQGLAAPFTALRIAVSFQRAGRCREALIAVLEQTTLPSRYPLVHDNALVDSGVLLVLGGGDGLRAHDVITTPGQAETARELAGLAAGPRTLLVLGPWVDAPDLAGNVHQVAPGSYCTSVWLALADEWSSWQREHDTVVLCDTEPHTGEGHIAVFRTGRGDP